MFLRYKSVVRALFSRYRFCQQKPRPNIPQSTQPDPIIDIQPLLAQQSTQPTSLNQEQLSALSTNQFYNQAMAAMNLHQYPRSLSLLRQAQRQLTTNFSEMINLRIYLLNRKSILLKLVDDPQLAPTLRQLFFYCAAFKGYFDPETKKSLNNAFLASVYTDRPGGLALVEHLNQESEELSEECRQTLGFYSSVLYAMEDATVGKAIEGIAKLEMNEENQVVLKNNMAWISIWANLHSKPEQLKKAVEQGLELFREAFLNAQETTNPQQLAFQRAPQDALLHRYILQTPLQKRSLLLTEHQRVKLTNKQSHIICMNIGQMYYRLKRPDEASFWLQLCMQHANKLGEFDRVIRAMIRTGSIFDLEGHDKIAERTFLDILFNATTIPSYSRRFALMSYIQFLHKRMRYYESMGYADQIQNFDPRDIYMERLQGLILPDYDFSY